MPIHINLLAEMQAAEEMRRRDPVKRFLAGCILLVVIALMISAWFAGKNTLAKGRITTVQTSVDSKTNAYARARVELLKVAVARQRLEALDKLQASRFLQGNLLNALQQATVDGVQLTRMRLDQSYEVGAGSKNGPGRSVEHISLYLGAKDFSPNPGDQVNKFKDMITRNSYFQGMLDKTNAVQLPSPPSAPQTENGKPFVTFALECRFADHTR
jgi:hypothetical protein